MHNKWIIYGLLQWKPIRMYLMGPPLLKVACAFVKKTPKNNDYTLIWDSYSTGGRQYIKSHWIYVYIYIIEGVYETRSIARALVGDCWGYRWQTHWLWVGLICETTHSAGPLWHIGLDKCSIAPLNILNEINETFILPSISLTYTRCCFMEIEKIIRAAFLPPDIW